MERTMNNSPNRFLEHTVLTIFMWVGIWGTISLLIDHFLHSFWVRLFSYFTMTSFAFAILCIRNHI